MTRGTSNANRDRYYSLANTKSDLKKIDNQRAQQRKEKQALKNRTMKKYIQSKKNVLAGVEDDEDMKEDGDAAMLLKDKELAKVDDDGDTELNQTPLSPAPEKYNGNQTDTEMKDDEDTASTQKPQSQPDTEMKEDKTKPSANSQQSMSHDNISTFYSNHNHLKFTNYV